MFDVSVLDGLLPEGARAKWVQTQAGETVLNITGNGWQVAVNEQLDDPGYAIAMAARQQSIHDEQTAIAAARSQWHETLQAIKEQHAQDRESKVQSARAMWDTSPAKSAMAQSSSES